MPDLKLIDAKFGGEDRTVADVLRKIARAMDAGDVDMPDHAVLIIGGGKAGPVQTYGIGAIEPTEAAGLIEAGKMVLLFSHLKNGGSLA